MIRRILCVCYANGCRSPMLEVLLRATLQKEGRNDVQVESAGTGELAAQDKPATENSITCMDERGLDLHSHRSRWIQDLNLKIYDLIICMDQKGADEVKSLDISETTRVIVANEDKGGIPNPWQKGLAAYQECSKVFQQVAKDIVKTYF